MDNSTIICRCEELNMEEIEEAIRQGASTFSDIKRLTRCGMGACQGKVCMNLVTDLIHNTTGKPKSEITLPRMRLPLTPVRLGSLITKKQSGEDDESFMDADSVLDQGVRLK